MIVHTYLDKILEPSLLLLCGHKPYGMLIICYCSIYIIIQGKCSNLSFLIYCLYLSAVIFFVQINPSVNMLVRIAPNPNDLRIRQPTPRLDCPCQQFLRATRKVSNKTHPLFLKLFPLELVSKLAKHQQSIENPVAIDRLAFRRCHMGNGTVHLGLLSL